MKRTIILFFFLVIGVTSCKKDPSLNDIVFKGKYLGKGCWPVIQVIDPSLTSLGFDLAETQWVGSFDTIYHNAIGAGPIPDTFKNGRVFYFTVAKLDTSNMLVNANCTTTKYILKIKSISFTKDRLNINNQ